MPVEKKLAQRYYPPATRSSDPMQRVRELERRLRGTTDPRERAIIVDALAPEYATRGDSFAAARVLASVETPVDDLPLRARILSLRGLVAAMQGESSALLDEALLLMDRLDDHARAQVTHRAGARSYYEGQAGPAIDHSLQSINYAEEVEWYWMAARSATTLYATSYDIVGDFQQAMFWLERTSSFANQANDVAFRGMALWGQYDLAAMLGEQDRHEGLQQLLRRQAKRPHYTETMLGVAADALGLAWHESFDAMLGVIDGGLTRVDLFPADMVLAKALRALALAGTGNLDEARIESRRAIGLSRTIPESEPPGMAFRRHLGRVVAGAVSIITGDAAAGLRSLNATRFVGSGPASSLARALTSGTIDLQAPELRNVRGYVMAIEAVSRAVLRFEDETSLISPAERELLALLHRGHTYSEAAIISGRSVNTVKTLLRRAYRKLEARNRAEATLRAHEQGLI